MLRTLLLPALLLAIACGDSHTPSPLDLDGGQGSDAGPGDAGAVADAGADRDAGGTDAGTADAGTADAGAGCDFRAPDVACAPLSVDIGDITFQVGNDGDCYCGDRIECDAHVGADGRLSISTAFCPGFCDACFPSAEATCRLPTQPAGVYEVLVNDRPGFELTTGTVLPHNPMGEICSTLAPPTEGCDDSPTFVPLATDGVCLPRRASVGQGFAVRVQNSCGSCFDHPGGCDAIVDASRANTVTLRPKRLVDECPLVGACPPACFATVTECWVPPLWRAGTWTVEALDGESIEIEVAEGSTPATGEQCFGAPFS